MTELAIFEEELKSSYVLEIHELKSALRMKAKIDTSNKNCDQLMAEIDLAQEQYDLISDD